MAVHDFGLAVLAVIAVLAVLDVARLVWGWLR